MRTVRYTDVPDRPWANGRGSTRLLWSDPADDRQISVAMLERPASFSVLPGTARLLVVLDPVVVELAIGGDRQALCQRDMIAFSGTDQVTLIALDRPGRVLNLICREDRWTPSINHSAVAPVGWITVPGGDLVVGPCPSPRSIAIHFLPIDRAPIII